MSTTAHITTPASPRPLSDTLTMARRNLLHNVRNPTGPILAIVGGMVILLLFVYVFGGTLGAGLIEGGTRSDYLAYITPAIVLMGGVGIMQMIAVWVALDMSEGIVARFRTMAIARSSVLAGHAYSGIVLVIISTVPLLGFAVLLGYRPDANGMQWLALAGFIVLIGIALSWLAVAFGLVTRRVENASTLPLIVLILPMVSSGFVPVDSFPSWLQGFARAPALHTDHQHDPRPARRHSGNERRSLGDRLAGRGRGCQLCVGTVAVSAAHHRSVTAVPTPSGASPCRRSRSHDAVRASRSPTARKQPSCLSDCCRNRWRGSSAHPGASRARRARLRVCQPRRGRDHRTAISGRCE